VEVNYIHGLHALLQQLIDQERMPIPNVVQKALAQSRGQLHQIIRAAEQGEGANLQPNNTSHHEICPYCKSNLITVLLPSVKCTCDNCHSEWTGKLS
jgi:c-di-GMP-related signal transduction protein